MNSQHRHYTSDAGGIVSVDRFGASAPADILLRENGFTVEAVCAEARATLTRVAATTG